MPRRKTTLSIDSNTRKIELSEGKIIYILRHDNLADYLTYNEMLYSVLQQDRIKPFRDEGRLRLQVLQDGVNKDMYLYDLAVACYMGFVQSPESFVYDVSRFRRYKRAKGLTIDHADGHLQNNTCLNLSLMSSQDNRTKASLASRIEVPALLISCYDDGQYRIHFEQRELDVGRLIGKVNTELAQHNTLVTGNPAGIMAIDVICNSPNQYVRCLKMLVGSSVSFEGKTIASALKNHNKWQRSGRGSYLYNVEISVKLQEMLAARPINEFCPFPSEPST